MVGTLRFAHPTIALMRNRKKNKRVECRKSPLRLSR
jgi:hypothetical protein